VAREVRPAYWFRVPDDETTLMSLPPAQFKCYMVVLRAIQRDRNAGRISVRQVAARARITSPHAHKALRALFRRGLLECEVRPRTTAVYSLPFRWTGDCIPIGEQIPSKCVPVRKQQLANPENAVRLSAGEQTCDPVGKRHLENSESDIESSSSKTEPPEFATTTNANKAKTKEPWWNADELRGAQIVLKQHSHSGSIPDANITARVLSCFADFQEFTLWLSELRFTSPARGWGLYEHDAHSNWPSQREEAQAKARRFLAPAAQDTGPLTIDARAVVSERLTNAEACKNCCGSGIRPATHDPQLWEWCECPAGSEKRESEPDAVDRANATVFKIRRLKMSA